MAKQRSGGITLDSNGCDYEPTNLASKNVQHSLHVCEVRSVVRMYREKGGDAVKSFLLLVEKHRGSDCAARLRNDALEALGKKNGGKA